MFFKRSINKHLSGADYIKYKYKEIDKNPQRIS